MQFNSKCKLRIHKVLNGMGDDQEIEQKEDVTSIFWYII